MNELDKNPRRYKWPWFVLAAVVLAIVLAALWVAAAARNVEQERGFNTPPPSTAPGH